MDIIKGVEKYLKKSKILSTVTSVASLLEVPGANKANAIAKVTGYGSSCKHARTKGGALRQGGSRGGALRQGGARKAKQCGCGKPPKKKKPARKRTTSRR